MGKAQEIFEQFWNNLPTQSATPFDVGAYARECSVIAIDNEYRARIHELNLAHRYGGASVEYLQERQNEIYTEWGELKKEIESL